MHHNPPFFFRITLIANSKLFSELASRCGEDSACVNLYLLRAMGGDSSVFGRIVDGGEHMFLDGDPVAGSGGVGGEGLLSATLSSWLVVVVMVRGFSVHIV